MIKPKIDEIKHSKTGGQKYMKLTGAFWQDARNEGRNEGRKEGKKQVLRLVNVVVKNKESTKPLSS